MTTSEQIRVLCVRTGVSLSELARRINQTPQNFNAKLKRNTITQDELNQIAKALDVTYEQYFVLGNGELTKKLTVNAAAFSASASEKIQKVGGTAEVK